MAWDAKYDGELDEANHWYERSRMDVWHLSRQPLTDEDALALARYTRNLRQFGQALVGFAETLDSQAADVERGVVYVREAA
jgi:hypothetical protein